LWNLHKLEFQYAWAGLSLYNTRHLVCPNCYDDPQRQLGANIIPPDPLPLINARPEQYDLDEEPVSVHVNTSGSYKIQAGVNFPYDTLQVVSVANTPNNGTVFNAAMPTAVDLSWVLHADNISANVDIDCANNRIYVYGLVTPLSSVFSVTRSTNAYQDDTSGNWTLFPPNTLRQTSKGCLIEESRTNLFLNSGAPVTQTVAVSNGSTYSVSVVGSGTVVLTGATGSSVPVSQGSPSTFTAVSGSLVCTTTGITGSFVNVNVELGLFPTSPIVTAATSATRAADVVIMTIPAPASACTLYAAGTPSANTSFLTTQTLLSIDDGTATNNAQLLRLLVTGNAGMKYDNTNTSSGVSWAQNTAGQLAAAFQAGNQALSFNAAAPTTAAKAGFPSGIASLRLGTSFNNTGFWNGYITRATLWSANFISNSGLQALT